MSSESPKVSLFRKILSDLIIELKSLNSDDGDNQVVILDPTPTGQEEEEYLFENPVADQTDLNTILDRAERIQDMEERRKFANRAFAVTVIWVAFLILLPLLQMIFSIWGVGLSDGQFIAVVTSTTAAVFGFWALVGRYLFPNKNSN